jgi:hypothetical protein
MKTGAERLIQACLVLAGVIHLLPSVGVLGRARLSALYGIPVEGPDLVILMRHRAFLFGILGVLLLAGAARSSLRNTAIAVGFASAASFLLLAATGGPYNAQVARVVTADVIALGALLVAAILQLRRERR